MGDRHLEAAAGALRREFRFTEPHATEVAQVALGAGYDSLLGELPEEAVEKAARELQESADSQRPWVGHDVIAADLAGASARAFLRSLRDSLASGQGQEGRDDG